ncbi:MULTISPECIES: ribbon-helix-helix protein, CopG family [Methylosinus]|uniref:Ribbon-helix-helix protein, CopG family n=1 Tax=Methylosinus trichosporium (strain ATCC 35070 / NCIMB 11131 / UNIQEM 75 / OB3b) TaxID=595536 RepID=A0A2D2D5K2_METT3|nr:MULTISPECIES: ribbon-helix-helix protein, CopG family [Methylosinus]ATQ70234.1 ribbon-helix-helix protein, CopG family [Methylosinus trichosporium OB3b]
MPRTIVSLSDSEKEWLTRLAETERVPVTEIVRRALALYRRQSGEPPSFDELLDRSHGLWREGDGLAYQRSIRDEWETS